MDVSDSQYCFVCGPDNPLGLKARIEVDRDRQSAQCSLAVPAEFQGWKQMVHGGIISVLLDEVSAYAAMTCAETVMTAELTSRFRKPVPVEQQVTVSAQVIKATRRTVMVEAKITMQGELLASSEATMVVVRSGKEN